MISNDWDKWDRVPAYRRPRDRREDPGLVMMYKWPPYAREEWQTNVEMGRDERDEREGISE